MAKSLLFVYNPIAGKREIVTCLHHIVNQLTVNGFTVTLHPTQANDDAFEVVAARGNQFDYVVCAGGDGTLNEVVHGIITTQGAKPILGYIPFGSTNDFAASYKIPFQLDSALEVITGGNTSCIDIGKLNDNRFFAYVAAFGLFTDVSYDTPQTMKNIFGHSAYVLEGMKRLTAIEPISCRFDLEDEVIEGEFLLGIITNSATIGGFEIPEKAIQNKKDFQLILLRYSPNILDYTGTVSALLGLKEPGPQFIIRSVDKIKITTGAPIAWTVDGEYGGDFTESHISIKKSIVKMLTP